MRRGYYCVWVTSFTRIIIIMFLKPEFSRGCLDLITYLEHNKTEHDIS